MADHDTLTAAEAVPAPPHGTEERASRLARSRAYLRARRRAWLAAGKSNSGRRLLAALAVLLVLLLGALGWALDDLSPSASGKAISLDALQNFAANRQVTSATFLDEDSRIVAVVQPNLAPSTGGKVYTSYPSTGALTAVLENALRAGGARVSVDGQAGKARVRFLAQFVLPVVLLADLFALLLTAARSRSSSIGDVVDFSSLSTGRTADQPIRFSDVGGADEAVAELAEVRDYLLDPERYRRLGAAPPKGVLMFGPPGTGKTLLAKAVAGEAGVPFFSVAGAQFVESLVGVGAARVRDLFTRVRAVAPAILFIDELDAVGRRRGAGGGTGGNDEREQTLNQLLVEMDGFEVANGIVVIAATNRPDILDPALMRPGRFDRHITLDRPEVEGREHILRIHARGKPMADDVDLSDVAHRTPGFTGADLANVVNEAALLTVRAGESVLTRSRITDAIDRVLSGPRRKGRLLSESELRRTALHEAGHAVVAAALGLGNEVSRVTVLPRAKTIGTTTITPEEESLRSSTLLRSRLAVLLAGIAAERQEMSDVSTASEGDIEKATVLARDMVTRYGMSEQLGRVRLAAPSTSGFLDDAVPLDEVSEATHAAVDAEVRALLDAAEAVAASALTSNARVLERLSSQLVTDEVIEGDALSGLLSGVRQVDVTSGGVVRQVRRRATSSSR